MITNRVAEARHLVQNATVTILCNVRLTCSGSDDSVTKVDIYAGDEKYGLYNRRQFYFETTPEAGRIIFRVIPWRNYMPQVVSLDVAGLGISEVFVKVWKRCLLRTILLLSNCVQLVLNSVGSMQERHTIRHLSATRLYQFFSCIL